MSLASCRGLDIFRAIVEELPEQIGVQLRRAREKAGLTVPDVVHRTRLPKAVLMALEEEDFAFFSSPIYARSFLSQYADFLDVDADRWVDAFEPAEFSGADCILSVVNDGGGRVSQAQPATQVPTGNAMAAFWLIVCTGLVVFGAIRGYGHLERHFEADPPVAEEKVEPVEAGAETEESALYPRAIVVQD